MDWPQFPEAKYDYWLKAASWTLGETVAILLGVEPSPKLINQLDHLELLTDSRGFAWKWGRLQKLVERQFFSYLGSDPSPNEVLNWVMEKDISIPEGLRKAAEKMGFLNATPFTEELAALKQKNEHLEKKNSQLRDENISLQKEMKGIKAQLKDSGKHIIETRAKILGAALYCIVNSPDECRSKSGKHDFKAAKIAQRVEDQRLKWFGDKDYPSLDTINKKILESLQDLSKKK